MDKGVLYIASGRQYIEEAIVSASSLEEYNIPCSLITAEEAEIKKEDEILFDNIFRKEGVHNDLRDKARFISDSPYDRTVYLDTDTIVLGDISPLFDILDRVDIAAAHSPVNFVDTNEVPDTFPEVNGGVIVYNNSEDVSELFDKWTELYEEQLENGFKGEKRDIGVRDLKHDQPPLREALYDCDISFSVLPREYNFRGRGATVSGEVKILHQRRLIENQTFIDNINSKETVRSLWRWRLFRKGEQDIIIEHNLLVRAIYHVRQLLPITEWLESIGQLKVARKYYQKYINR